MFTVTTIRSLNKHQRALLFLCAQLKMSDNTFAFQLHDSLIQSVWGHRAVGRLIVVIRALSCTRFMAIRLSRLKRLEKRAQQVWVKKSDRLQVVPLLSAQLVWLCSFYYSWSRDYLNHPRLQRNRSCLICATLASSGTLSKTLAPSWSYGRLGNKSET